MLITCSKCGEMFKSLIIDNELAFAEVCAKLITHVNAKHKEDHTKATKAAQLASMALVGFMLAVEFMDVPEGEQWIKDALEKQLKVVMTALGYDEQVDNEDKEEKGSQSNPNSSQESPAV